MYTHYWRRSKDEDISLPVWSTIREKITRIIQSTKIPIEDVEITDEHIRFNGVGEDGHETFLFTRNCNEEFDFCKTARKPYDLLVQLCLLTIKEEAPFIKVTSDGEWINFNDNTYCDGWQDALAKYKKLFGAYPPSWDHWSPLQ